MAKPKEHEFGAFNERYIHLVDANSIADAIKKYSGELLTFFENIPAEKAAYRYAENKWSLKEMLQHIIDAERVFSYRAMCFARHDATPLPGFDENDYAYHSKADSRSWNELLEEFKAVRTSTDLLYKSLSEEQLKQTGICNSKPASVNALAFITFGHILHHKNIVLERYL